MQDSASRWFAWHHIGSQLKKNNFIKCLGLIQHKFALLDTIHEGLIHQKTIP